jgi:hypothetical protein
MKGIFLFSTASRMTLGPTQPPLEEYTGIFPPGVNWPGRITDHSPPHCAEVKNAWSQTFTPSYGFKAWYTVKLGYSESRA